MNFCIYCGASHEASDQFCSACGRGIVQEHEHFPDEVYPQEVVYEDDDLYRVNLNDDETVFVREDDGYSGDGYHQQVRHPLGHPTHQQTHDPSDDSMHQKPSHRRSSKKKKSSGKGILIALCLIVGLALLAGAGYFVVYPMFFGDRAISDEEGLAREDDLPGEGDDNGQEASDQRVQEVIQAIDGIHSDALTFEDESVQAVRQMYNALTPQEQALVTNISRLEELEELVALLVAEEAGRMPADEERVKRFEVIERAMTWREAYQYARSRGGYLATVVNQEEFDQIAQLASATDLRVLWLGAQRGAGGNFYWITGEAFVFSHWFPGEPTPPDDIENYLSMMWVDDQWRWVNIPNDVSDVYQEAWIGFVIAWDEE